ncbi:hypothetical protein FACS1894126_0940 [Alphaproteobacteria bacterium]|nr:hypothetical protein FACS1894122_12080 [Alphaproteobacteria bacterium]GHT97245.1 hypothetical protein FACS1894126_0940 [Alphaproteobacteria bacterium]
MFNRENLESIEKAISELQSGRRVTSVWYGDTRIQYASVDLQDLLNFRNRIKAGLDDQEKTNKRRVFFTTTKGLK